MVSFEVMAENGPFGALMGVSENQNLPRSSEMAQMNQI